MKKYVMAALIAGIFFGVGVDPEEEVAKALISVIENYSTIFAWALRAILVISGVIAQIKFWIDIYQKHHIWGIFNSSLVFFGIAFLIWKIDFGVWMLLVGILFGFIL